MIAPLDYRINFEHFTSVKSETHEDHEIIEFNEEDTELIDTGEAGTSMSFIQTSPIEEKKQPTTKATSFTGNPSKFYQLWESKLNSNVLINLIFNSLLFLVIALKTCNLNKRAYLSQSL